MTASDLHRMRLVPDGVPHVYGAGDAVVLQMSTSQAEVLGRVLSHYDAIARDRPVDVPTGYDAAVWHHVLIELFTVAARINTVGVPFLLTTPPKEPT